MLQENAKLQESLEESLSLGSGFSVKILKLACFVLFVRNGEGHTSKCKRKVDLLTGTMAQTTETA